MQETILHKDILNTLAYFDVFDFPLTSFEAWRYHINTSRLSGDYEKCPIVSYFEVERTLQDLEKRGSVEFLNGFYFLAQRSKLVSQRIRRTTDSLEKLKRLRRIIRLVSFLPFVRMVAVTGRLALHNVEKGSDWDVLIVLKKGRIWIGRTFVTGFLQSIGKRRWGKKTRDRVCLNYFVTDKSLEIRVKDLFAAKEYAFMLPIFGTRVFEDFCKKNVWIRDYIPMWDSFQANNHFILPDSAFASFIRRILEIIFDSRWLEDRLRRWQTRKIWSNPKTSDPESYIVADEDSLVFLPSPQGPRVFEKFKEILKNIR